ncbi:MAG: hypothetical protein P8L77_04175 [Gammaproteobacteria bacterium]|nr:hypothetical protein [Gammaproteobacteria bacterium]
MASEQSSNPWIYTTSLIASFMIGLDCFVIGFIFLYPFIGLVPAILVASGGWVLNAFVYYKDGPEGIREFLEAKGERSLLSWIVNAVAFLGALFMLLFTIYAYVSLSATMPVLSMWVTPFLIAIMSTAYFVGTFTLNKSELTKDLLQNQQQSLMESFRNAVLERLDHQNNQSSMRFAWLFLIRIFVPVLIALIVSLALTITFYNGCAILLASCGLSFLNQILVIMAIAFFGAECYFNIKQNLGLVDSLFDTDSTKNSANNKFTLGMMMVFVLALANAIANGFIAMDGAMVAITAVVLIKFVTGMLQSLFTMLNCCFEFMSDDTKSLDTLNGGHTDKVLYQSTMVIAGFTGLYVLSIFASPITFGITSSIGCMALAISMLKSDDKGEGLDGDESGPNVGLYGISPASSNASKLNLFSDDSLKHREQNSQSDSFPPVQSDEPGLLLQ